MPMCPICKKSAYAPDRNRICFQCRKKSNQDALDLGIYYHLKGHSIKCASRMGDGKNCTCQIGEEYDQSLI